MKYLLLTLLLLLQGCWVTIELEPYDEPKKKPVHHKQVNSFCGPNAFMGHNPDKRVVRRDNHELIIYTSPCVWT